MKKRGLFQLNNVLSFTTSLTSAICLVVSNNQLLRLSMVLTLLISWSLFVLNMIKLVCTEDKDEDK